MADNLDELRQPLNPGDEEEAKPKLPFVIGAGLGRTGTTSLYAALQQLGYKTMHMKDFLGQKTKNPDILFDWGKAKRSKADDADQRALAAAQQILDDGFTATTDFPACLLYKELMDLDPNAKVILSIRSNAESWADSVLTTIGAVGPLAVNKAPFKYNPFMKRYYDDLYPYFWEEIGLAPLGTIDCTKPLDRDALLKAYHEWIERVKATVPEDKLLIHQSKDGFRPICEHLGIPYNEDLKEFPHLNDSESFKTMLKHMKRAPCMFYTKITCFFIAVFIILYLIIAGLASI